MNKIYTSKEIVEKILSHFEVIESGNNILQKRTWDFFVGSKLSTHSKLIEIKNNTAIIETDHPGWAQQLLFQKKTILRNFKKIAPELEIKSISVRIQQN